jgi:hypothetical protein
MTWHNHIVHTVNFPHGANGFRYYRTKPPNKNFVLCPCGWRPDLGPHYACKDHAALYCDGKNADALFTEVWSEADDPAEGKYMLKMVGKSRKRLEREWR